jgi:hypothetical protein
VEGVVVSCGEKIPAGAKSAPAQPIGGKRMTEFGKMCFLSVQI